MTVPVANEYSGTFTERRESLHEGVQTAIKFAYRVGSIQFKVYQISDIQYKILFNIVLISFFVVIINVIHLVL